MQKNPGVLFVSVFLDQLKLLSNLQMFCMLLKGKIPWVKFDISTWRLLQYSLICSAVSFQLFIKLPVATRWHEGKYKINSWSVQQWGGWQVNWVCVPYQVLLGFGVNHLSWTAKDHSPKPKMGEAEAQVLAEFAFPV